MSDELTVSDLTTVDPDVAVFPSSSTGPRTPEGKAIASSNARTHGCCSRQLVMRDENQEDYDRLRAYWFKRFAPDPNNRQETTEHDELKHALIQNAVDNQWLLLRAQRRFGEIEQHVAEIHAACWTEDDMHRFGLFQRYLGNAERAFHRALHVFERYEKDHLADQQHAAEHQSRLELTAARLENVKAATSKTLRATPVATNVPTPMTKSSTAEQPAKAHDCLSGFAHETQAGHPGVST